MKVFFSVGEPSGDVHGANLIRALKQRDASIECVGYGGPRMAAAGCNLHEDLTLLAVMWFGRVLLNLHRFLGLLWRAERCFRHDRPDAVILIDYPGFNWHIARRAKKHGIPVFYYGVPQIWAWAGWRIRKMRRLVDHALCKLPFEEAWYRERGCHAVYVGHPFFDETRQHQVDQPFLDELKLSGGPVVAILPGSRMQEVEANLPWFLKAANLVSRKVPEARFVVASFNEKQARLARTIVIRSGLNAQIVVGKTPEVIHAAACCMACSGSVSLELLDREKPTVILYWIGRWAYQVQLRIRRVKYITLVNLLAADDRFPQRVGPHDLQQPAAQSVPFPEYLTCQDESRRIAAHVTQWLTDTAKRDRKISQLRVLKQQFASPGASVRAAEYILKELQRSRATAKAA